MTASGWSSRILNLFINPEEAMTFEDPSDGKIWKRALAIQLLFVTLLTVVWNMRVDWLSFFENMRDRAPGMTAQGAEMSTAFMEKWGLTFGLIGVYVAIPLFVFGFALFYWLIGRRTFTSLEAPTYNQALAVATVSGLAVVPSTLITTLMSLIKEVGGTSIERLSPTNLSFWVEPSSLKLDTLIQKVDLFTLFAYYLVYVGSKTIMKTSKAGSLMCALVPPVLYFLFLLYRTRGM